MSAARTPGDRPALPLGDRRMIVTGAGGFIGRHLLRHLRAAGVETHAAIRPGSPRGVVGGVVWHPCDLADTDAIGRLFDEVAPHAVLHLASRVEGGRDPELVSPMLEDNTRIAVNVMTAARREPVCRVVLAGSMEEPHGGEETPSSPYAAAKAATTGYARLFHDQWELGVAVLRLAMVYGPDQPDRRKLVPHVITHLLDGRPPPLGSGTREVDWVHVDDVCEAFLLAATEPAAAGLVADVGSATAVSIADTVELIADLVADVTGHRVPVGFGDLGDRPRETARIADPAAAADVLGWRARTPLRAGLEGTVRWHHEHTDGRLPA